jgi:hypothetical protein
MLVTITCSTTMEDNNQNQEKTNKKEQKPAADKKPVLKIDPNKTIPYIQEGSTPKNSNCRGREKRW